MLVQETQKYVDYIKWRIFSHTSSEGSGKNKKNEMIFPTGLEVHLEDMF